MLWELLPTSRSYASTNLALYVESDSRSVFALQWRIRGTGETPEPITVRTRALSRFAFGSTGDLALTLSPILIALDRSLREVRQGFFRALHSTRIDSKLRTKGFLAYFKIIIKVIFFQSFL